MREIEPAEALPEPAVGIDIVIADRDNLRTRVLVLLIVRPKGG
jgi:hypothetical protein